MIRVRVATANFNSTCNPVGYTESEISMSKTIHVYHAERGWAIKRVGGKVSQVFSTQREAIKTARLIARKSAPSQMVVLGKDGRIKDYVTHGLPRVQYLPGVRSTRIEKAVGRLALERLAVGPNPPRA